MTYTGFRVTGVRAVTSRPSDKDQAVPGSTWARDRSAPGANDGTEVDATFLNRIRVNLEGLVTALGGNLADGDAQLSNAAAALMADIEGRASITGDTFTGDLVIAKQNPSLLLRDSDNPAEGLQLVVVDNQSYIQAGNGNESIIFSGLGGTALADLYRYDGAVQRRVWDAGNFPAGERIALDGADNALNFRSTDGALNLQIGDRDLAVNRLLIEGGATGNGPVLAAIGTDINVDINYAGQGTGGHRFGNGMGLGFHVINAGLGAELTHCIQAYGGDGTTNPGLQSTEDFDYKTPLSHEHIWRVNSEIVGKIKASSTAAQTSWAALVSSPTSSPSISFEGSAASVNGWIRTKGSTPETRFLNDQGSALLVSPNGATKNGLVIRPSAAGTPVRVYPSNMAYDSSGDTAPILSLETTNVGSIIRLWGTAGATGLEQLDNGAIMLPRLAAAPASPAAAWSYFDTAMAKRQEYNGSAWLTPMYEGQGITRGVRVVTAAGAITVTATDDLVVVNKTVGAATAVTLPSSPVLGRIYTIKDGKGDAAANPLTLTPASGNIDGAPDLVVATSYGSADVFHNGTEWNVV